VVSDKASEEIAKEGDIEKHYRSSIVALAQSLIDAISTSRATEGLLSGKNGKRFWASVLLSRLCALGVSLQRILPRSASNAAGRAWDSAGALSLCRAMFEANLAMFYLCLDQMSEDDYSLRMHLVYLHDCIERPRIVEKFSGSFSEEGKEFHENEAKRLKAEIAKNPMFAGLPEHKKKRLFEGKTPYHLSQDELLQRQGVDAKALRGIWELLSSHVHSYPFSYYRSLMQKDRGTGRENEVDKSYCGLSAQLSASMLQSATNGMKQLFPEVETVPRCTIDWDTLACRPTAADGTQVMGLTKPKYLVADEVKSMYPGGVYR
jgi:Family of unknown function (DUF5677)